MGWVLRLVETGADGQPRSADILEICRPGDLNDIANLGLTLREAKQLLARVQQEVVSAQARGHAVLRPECRSCGRQCHLKDWRLHQIATLFGGVTMRLPRFRCAGCGRNAGAGWPRHCRSTPELDQLQAHFSALMSYRVAAGVLRHLLPVDSGRSPETLRGHTLKAGERLRHAGAVEPAAPAPAIAIALDSTFVRSCEDGERHLEVRAGSIETADGGRRFFGAVAKAGSDLAALIRRSFAAIARNDNTEVTAFTDGCPALRSILADAGVAKPPILDWFHIAMRLQHVRQVAAGLSTDNAARAQAKSMIVEEAERLRWRIWNGKAKNARRTIDRIRKVMHAFKGESASKTSSAPSRRLWTALREADRYFQPK
jgi:DDE family transposase